MLVTGKAASRAAVNSVCSETPPNGCMLVLGKAANSVTGKAANSITGKAANSVTGKAANSEAVNSVSNETPKCTGKLPNHTAICYTGCITGLPSAGAFSSNHSCISIQQQCV